MTLRCKHCGAEISLTERESSQIAADLDRRLSFAQQARLTFAGVCGDCWETERHAAESGSVRRVQFVNATT
jgi:hypothetical protein